MRPPESAYLASPALVIVDDTDWERVDPKHARSTTTSRRPSCDRDLPRPTAGTLGHPEWLEAMRVLALGVSGCALASPALAVAISFPRFRSSTLKTSQRFLSSDVRIGPCESITATPAAVIAVAGRAAERPRRAQGRLAVPYRPSATAAPSLLDVVFPSPGGPTRNRLLHQSPDRQLWTFFTASARTRKSHGVRIGHALAVVPRLLRELSTEGRGELGLGGSNAALTVAFLAPCGRRRLSALHVVGAAFCVVPIAAATTSRLDCCEGSDDRR